MGHSGGSDITSNYIGAYPLAKMLEYNYYLLNDKKALLEMLKGLSEEERMELIANLSDNYSCLPQEHQVKHRKNTE